MQSINENMEGVDTDRIFTREVLSTGAVPFSVMILVSPFCPVENGESALFCL